MTATYDITLFISGALAAGYAIAALFFLKFWKQTGDRLFAFFAAAFTLLLVQRVALTLALEMIADASWFYIIRLLAFVLILVAVVDKNRATRD